MNALGIYIYNFECVCVRMRERERGGGRGAEAVQGKEEKVRKAESKEEAEVGPCCPRTAETKLPCLLGCCAWKTQKYRSLPKPNL